MWFCLNPFSILFLKNSKKIKHTTTAVIGATDNIVLGFLRYAVEKGYNVPDEISVAGFGGYDVGLAIHPPITTINIDYEILGMKVAESIISSIEGIELTEDKNIPIELVKRESVKTFNKE